MSEYRLPPTDEELLDECDVDTFFPGGKGGQHANKNETAVRMRHRPTGLVSTSRRERSQARNKQSCLESLRSKIEKLNMRQAPRVPTKVPRKVKLKIAEHKRQRSQTKKLRRAPNYDE